MSKRLIINADDLGLTPGVNRGILYTHLNGILTSTTAMVNVPDAEVGIQRLQAEAPALGIGLHLILSHGKPILPAEQVPSLVTTDGEFVSKFVSLFERIERFQPDDIAAELNAQFERFVAIAGRKPDHLDGHHHLVYTIPAALDVLLQLAREHQLPMRNGSAFVSRDRWRRLAAEQGRSESDADTVSAALEAVYAAHPPPRWTDHFESRFYDTGVTRDNLMDILINLPDGVTEIMCHPGFPEDIPSGYAAPRRAEIELLIDPAIAALVAEQQIKLITFAGLELI